MWPTPSAPEAFRRRRDALAARLAGKPALLAAGRARAKNFPANRYPFRATSHFLYLVGRPEGRGALFVPGAAVWIRASEQILFAPTPSPDHALWEGSPPSFDELASELGIDVRPLADLEEHVAKVRRETATLPPQDDATAAWLSALLGRNIFGREGAKLAPGPDATLADAMIDLRLVHDEAATAQMRQAALATHEAHIAGMAATRPGIREAVVAGAMQARLSAQGMGLAYNPIVTVHGEVLHAEAHDGLLAPGDLLLADVGGETPEGWAADVTRTWPVSGTFSATQRAAYDLVLEVQRAAIDSVRPGASYRTIHQQASRATASGLVDLGILRGSIDGLVERGAHALFFPHGIGHLIGLDVHDMEDLGDRAGYAHGRVRSSRFGDRYLRLDRELVAGMAVTIEPGFYVVPAILADQALVGPLESDLDRAAVSRFSDVRGIRIEDDVRVTAGDPEVLTQAIPKAASDIERLVGAAQ